MVDPVPGLGPEESPSRRRLNPRAVRALVVLVLVGALVVLVVQNSRRVSIRFLFITGHVGLIWVIVFCLVVGGAVGFVAGRRSRRRRRRRQAQ